MWKRSDIKSQAKVNIHRNYWRSVLISLLMIVMAGGITFSYMGEYIPGHPNLSEAYNFQGLLDQETMIAFALALIPIVSFVLLISLLLSLALNILILNPLEVGANRFFAQNHSKKAQTNEVTFGFEHQYKKIVETMFFRDLYLFLWTLLLIIPGIVKSYEYRMIIYIMGEQPEIGREEAFRLSKEMMYGQKWNAFVLDLSFLGWYLLSVLTLGILDVFYVAPYKNQTNAELYQVLKKKYNNAQPGNSEVVI
ncbi:MAG: DUF975 family protein [Lachnospiraceae bacterium]